MTKGSARNRAVGAAVGAAFFASAYLSGASQAGAAVTLRQVLPIGSQETYLAGIALTSRGGARFGAPVALKRRLGPGWVCGGSLLGTYRRVTWRRTLDIGLSWLGVSPPCDPAATAVGHVGLRARGQKLVTAGGSVTVGQRWADVSRRVRATQALRVVNGESGEVIIGLGRRQTACGTAPPAGSREPVVIIGLSGASERVGRISVSIPIHEGEDCSA